MNTFYVTTRAMRPHRIIEDGSPTKIPTRPVDVNVVHWPRLGRWIAWILHAYRKLPKTH